MARLERVASGWRKVVAWNAAGRSLARFGTSARDRLAIRLASLYLPARRVIRALGSRAIRLTIAYRGRRFSFWLRDPSELLALVDVFSEEQYRTSDTDNLSTIVDLGANIGAASAWFHATNPSASIYGFEPDPDTFGRLAATVGRLPRVEVFPVAAAAHDGEATLYSLPGKSWSSSLTWRPGAIAHRIEARRLDTLLDQLEIAHVDLLKVDIEGAEVDVFTTLSSGVLERVDTIIGEFHARMPAVASRRAEFAACFAEFDFAFEQRGHECVFVARRATSGLA
jgi:FkbM family methyltransferase